MRTKTCELIRGLWEENLIDDEYESWADIFSIVQYNRRPKQSFI